MSNALQKINLLFQQVRECLLKKQSFLPFLKYQKDFNFQQKKYVLINPSKLIFNRKSLKNVLRLIEILKIVQRLLINNKLITKRSLYYQLAKYYPIYARIDLDLQLICDTLKVSRQKLNIIASNKLLICGNITLLLDDKDGLDKQFSILQCKQTNFINLPNCKTIKIFKIQAEKIIIVQKQSIFYKLSQQKVLYPNTLIISSKGYPDNLTRQFLQQIKQIPIKIYYLGDYDIYGVDVMMTYAFGMRYSGLGTKLNWLQIYNLFKFSEEEREYSQITISKQKFEQEHFPFQKDDLIKATEILDRKQLKELEKYQPKTSQDEFFKQKLLKWIQKIKQMIEIGKKIQLESFFKFQDKNPNLINFLIEKQIYI